MEGKKHIVHVSAMVVREDKRFIIIKRRKDEIAHPGVWSCPGGKAEGDEKVLDVLKREVKEEVGLDIEERYDFLWDYAFQRPDGHTVKGFCFRVWPASDKVNLGDSDEYAWVSVEEIDKYEFAPGAKEKMRENSWKWTDRPKG